MKWNVVCWLWLLIGLTASGAPAPVHEAPQKKTDAPAQKKADAAANDAAPKPAEPVVPNLQELLTKPVSPMRMVTQRYEADRGNLTRTYTVWLSPARIARMTKFYGDWGKALAELDAAKFNDTARAELKQLQDTVKRQQRELEQQKKTLKEVSALIPFGGAIVELEDNRRKMQRVDSQKAAGALNEVIIQISKSQKALEPSFAKDAKSPPPPAELRSKAADTVRDLRTALRNWHGFYDGYDPMFTWWMGESYKTADKALQDYMTLLRTKVEEPKTESKDAVKTVAKASTGAKSAAKPAVTATDSSAPQAKPAAAPNSTAVASDVPDLATLLAFPQSEFQEVIRKYQSGRSSLGGRFSTMAAPPVNAPRSADRQARAKKFYGEWQTALRKLSFDSLSHDAQIDYLLLQNQIQHELRRADNPLPPRGNRRRGDDLSIEGRPIGRKALLDELALEMIPYTPEELIALANKEFSWCDVEMRKASHEMGFGDDWKKAVEKVKTMYVEPGHQPELIRELAWEAIDYIRKNDLVTVLPLASETWHMQMMTPQRQLVSPFFTGGEVISVSYPTNTMTYEARMQSMRGNNIPFARATVHHELFPGHGLQQFMTPRYRNYRSMFGTPFWTEGWSLYWEFILYDRGFPKTPEDRVGFLTWRMHRCARIIFSLNYHLGNWPAQKCVDFVVDRVGFERDNATAEVRRSFTGGYGPLYQAAYMLGGLQLRALHKELVDSGKMTDRAFHDAILQENRIPITMVRAALTKQQLSPDKPPEWRFYGPIEAPKALTP